jgi:hypothetical protein
MQLVVMNLGGDALSQAIGPDDHRHRDRSHRRARGTTDVVKASPGRLPRREQVGDTLDEPRARLTRPALRRWRDRRHPREQIQHPRRSDRLTRTKFQPGPHPILANPVEHTIDDALIPAVVAAPAEINDPKVLVERLAAQRRDDIDETKPRTPSPQRPLRKTPHLSQLIHPSPVHSPEYHHATGSHHRTNPPSQPRERPITPPPYATATMHLSACRSPGLLSQPRGRSRLPATCMGGRFAGGLWSSGMHSASSVDLGNTLFTGTSMPEEGLEPPTRGL